MTMLCHAQCSMNQDQLIENVITDHEKVTEITTVVHMADADELFDICSKAYILGFYRLVDHVCLRSPCDAKEFLRSLGTNCEAGGQSPFQINFVFV